MKFSLEKINTLIVDGTTIKPHQNSRPGSQEHSGVINGLTISDGALGLAGAPNSSSITTAKNSAPKTYVREIPRREELKILRLAQVLEKVGLSRSTIYNLIAEGSFPRKFSIGARAQGFYEHEIDAWILQRGRSGQ